MLWAVHNITQVMGSTTKRRHHGRPTASDEDLNIKASLGSFMPMSANRWRLSCLMALLKHLQYRAYNVQTPQSQPLSWAA